MDTENVVYTYNNLKKYLVLKKKKILQFVAT